jgi:hypothetical protein
MRPSWPARSCVSTAVSTLAVGRPRALEATDHDDVSRLPASPRVVAIVPIRKPRALSVAGRQPCRTVIHQIKQDSFKVGKSCDANPFFKIEARPFGEHVRFFAQVAPGTPCDRPPMVRRVQICRWDLPRESWTTVHVRLNPAHDASGQVDIWLNGSFCGSYQGPMADRDYGVRRNGTPFINAQPRFGIYRDWRAETQTIYFDKIMFWNADPSGHPDWGVSSPPG